MLGIFTFPTLVFAVALPTFLWAEYRAGRRTTLLTKLTCSLCFIVFGILGAAFGRQGPVAAYDGLMLAGLFLSLVGDLALVWGDQRRMFMLGLAAFLTAHLLYTAAFILANGLALWDLPILAALLAFPLTAYRFLDMDCGKMKGAVLAYMVVISVMLTTALSTLYLGGISGPAYWLVPIGAVLFYFSDGILALVKFRRRCSACFRAINLITYYLGQVLLALSLFFF
jgi:uncharacterized membrane protein YhhN